MEGRDTSHPRPEPSRDEDLITAPSAEARASFGLAFERIVALMARLRAEGGCPWDRAQDLKTLRPYLIEEAYEVLDALERGSPLDHREELGDLLLQVVFHAEIRRQEGAFDAADVAHAIADKLVRRHPHVFGDRSASSANQALLRWEEMKAKEKAGRSVLSGVPQQLPALLRAQRVGEKAHNVGFDWGDVSGPLSKLEEELAELRAAVASGQRAAVEHELGDALFSLVNLARFFEVSAEDALRATVQRFSDRFAHVERVLHARGKTPREATLEEMDALWDEAKALEAKRDG
ncbi:nucleoside triphosphate pyrophosphohydrolase [Myxococcota bacterium]|nr:nucleoside triphosphate pyrophosphohydrolase [Myxococcota bacterium]